jgi:hypothetical protein
MTGYQKIWWNNMTRAERYAPASLKSFTIHSLDVDQCVAANPVSGGWKRSMLVNK